MVRNKQWMRVIESLRGGKYLENRSTLHTDLLNHRDLKRRSFTIVLILFYCRFSQISSVKVKRLTLLQSMRDVIQYNWYYR